MKSKNLSIIILTILISSLFSNFPVPLMNEKLQQNPQTSYGESFFFSQRDPQWWNDPIIDEFGTTQGTIESIGCAMTSSAMILKYYSVNTDPKDLNSWLNQNSGYASGGLLYWSKSAQYSSGLITWIDNSQEDTWFFWDDDYQDWLKLKLELDNGYPVIVEVDNNLNTPALEGHWIVVTGFIGGDITDPSNYYINDPWDYPQNPNKLLSHYYDANYDNTFFAMRFYRGTLEAEPFITSDLTLYDNEPYKVGDTITGTFTIRNDGYAPITFEILTIGGRDSYNQVADFTFDNWVTLNPGQSYTYQGSLYLEMEGVYHFFCAYKTPDGNWNTAIPTLPGVLNTVDIIVDDNNDPYQPNNLRQFESDGLTQISENGVTSDSTIVFKGIVSDPDGDNTRLEIELREIGDPFTGEPTFETISNYVPSGTELTITRYGLIDASYHWQCRTRDSNGAYSGWIEFGSPGNVDFTIDTSIFNPPNVPYSLQQLEVDWVTHIPEGGMIYEDAVVFNAIVDDPNGDDVYLEIELRQINEQFQNQPTPETVSEVHSSGSRIYVSRGWLSNANYHWQCRSRDSNGAYSEWIEFGTPGNVDFIINVPVNQPPNIPFSLEQLKTSDSSWIPEGGTSSTNMITFQGIVSDPDEDEVSLEIELRQINEPLIGEPTLETISPLATSGSQVSVTRFGLVNGDYHWQYRASDNYGLCSDWREFGTPGNIDFAITTNNPPQLSNGYVDPTSGEILDVFNFYVTYTDVDGDYPLTTNVYIDDYLHCLEPEYGDISSGMVYKLSKNLLDGSHDFYFLFEDNSGNSVRYPNEGYLTGPTVSYDNSFSFEWDQTWGENEYKYSRSFTVDTLGNIYHTGSDVGRDSSDLYLTKFNSEGVELWSTSWGGEGSDYGTTLIKDSTGNIIVGGDTESYGYGELYTPDICVIKYTPDGQELWSYIWGGDKHDYCRAISMDSNNNIYVAGQTRSFGDTGYDMFLFKLDSFGNFLWSRLWGGYNWEECHGVEIDSFNNVYLVGNTDSYGSGSADISLVKFDGNGNVLWFRTWGGSGSEYGSDLVIDNANNIFITGSIHLNVGGDFQSNMVLLKYDQFGDFQWSTTRDDPKNDFGERIAIDSLNNIYIAGQTDGEFSQITYLVKYSSIGMEQWYQVFEELQLWRISGGLIVDLVDNIYLLGEIYTFFRYIQSYSTVDNCLIKLDASGVKIWEFKWGGTNYDRGIDSVVDHDGNVYVAGMTESYGAESTDLCLLKYNSDGTLLWSRIWGTKATEGCTGMAIDSKNNIYLTGFDIDQLTFEYDPFIIKYDTNGNFLWSKYWGGSDSEMATSITVDNSDDVYITGCIGSLYTDITFDLFLIKFDSLGNVLDEKIWHQDTTSIPTSIIVDPSKNIYITGMVSDEVPFWGDPDIFIIKLNQYGIEQWYETWGTPEGYEYAFSIALDSSDDLYIGGSINNDQLLLVKYNGEGVEQWSRTWGGLGQEIGYKVYIDNYDNIYIAGITSSFSSGYGIDICLAKFDPTGQELSYLIWNKGIYDYCETILVDMEGNLYIAGFTTFPDENYDWDLYLGKFSQETPNQPPTLSNGYVDQPSGDTTTVFNYYVTYTDPDGDAPIMKYVYIDGSPHIMTKIGGNYISGAIFRYSTTFSAGSHNYYFDFDDGHGHSKRFPTSETIYLPYVSLDESGLVYGTAGGLLSLDPQYSWDSASINVIDQVCEGLYAYDLSDPNLAIIPNLAAAHGTWSSDKLSYTVPLKEGVIFHDGTPFDANAVKWSFDRLNYFLNVSGELPADVGKTILEELYVYRGKPIINRIEVVNDYTVRFVLNEPYVPFQALLCFSGSYILSPASTPEKQYIDTTTGDLVGTGPFVFDGYQYVDVRFHAFEDYWAGTPDIKTLVFSIIPDANERNQALLAGNIDLITDSSFSMLDIFEADPDITVVEAEQDLIIYYLGMNNKQINKTMRQAISFAINYDYIINEIMEGQAVRMKSPIPEGILYANWEFNVATMNVQEARRKLVSGGVCNFDVYNDAKWLDAATNNPLATYNYTYNLGNYARENIGLLLQDNLAKIGIKVELKGMNWYDYVDRLYNVSDGHNKLQLYFIGWGADYNDPSNFINPLFSNTSVSNVAQVNDPKLQGWMEQALTEFNPTIRKQLYDQIQQYIVEDLMPWAFCYVGIDRDAYRSDIIGFQSNPMGRVRFYGVTRLGLNQPPNCIIELQQGGSEIQEIDVGEFFDIYVGDSTDDSGIEQVRFSSDDEQDGIPSGIWTDWYSWDTTSGDWNAETKIKRWLFGNGGDKEVWAEVIDANGRIGKDYTNIYAVEVSLILTVALELSPIKDFYYIGDTLTATFTIKNNRNYPITLDVITVGGRLNGWIPEEGAPDFTHQSVTLMSKQEYQYEGTITLNYVGNYHFFVAYYIENPSPNEEVLLDENNWNTCINLGEGLIHVNRVKNIYILDEPIIPEDYYELEQKIDLLLNTEVNYPPNFLEEISFYSRYASFWFSFGTWITQTHLTENYKNIYQAGIDLDSLSYISLENAKDAFDRGFIIDAKNYLNNYYKFQMLSSMSFSAASELFDNGLEVAQLIMYKMMDVYYSAAIIIGKVVNPVVANVAEAMLLGIDFCADWYFYGLDTAVIRAISKALFKYIFFELPPIFLPYNSPSVQEYINTQVGFEMFHLITELFKDSRIQQLALEFLQLTFTSISKHFLTEYYIKIVDYFLSLQNRDEIRVKSPAELGVFNSNGEFTGITNNKVIHGISRSYFFNDTIVILFPKDTYFYILKGLEEGSYGLEINIYENGVHSSFSAENIPISVNEIHQYEIGWSDLSQGEEGVTVEIDFDGDGTIEHSFTSDNELNTAEYAIETLTWVYEGDALQDGVIFDLETFDNTHINWITVSIREPGGEDGLIISDEFENILLVYDDEHDIWESINFDTTQLPDGYYVLFIQVNDASEFTSKIIFDFSIRNWAILELLPSTKSNKPGRTMPVKFSLRVAESVDSNMPFVVNDELCIIIYDFSDPSVILQESYFGDSSNDYRIDIQGELYITNFKTSKTPAIYVVEIWRKDMLIGNFTFSTMPDQSLLLSLTNYTIFLPQNSIIIFFLVAVIIVAIIPIKKVLEKKQNQYK